MKPGRAVLMLFCASIALTLAARLAAAPPNVVLIISDDQAWTDFGFMGHETIRTPNLDRLANESLVFVNGYVPASLCCPSLASMVTGLSPFEHGITGNEPPRPRGAGRNSETYRAAVRAMIAKIDDLPSLPRLLGDAGYRSLQTGKWWLGDYARGGFTHGMTHGDPDRGGRHGDAGLAIGRQGMEPIFEFIDDPEDDRPFFVWYAPFLPHRPHDPPARLLEKYAARNDSIHVARYQACCEWLDETCGALLDHLDRRGLTESTIVLFVTDNGWIQREDAPGYAPRSKRSPYDGGLRTPIMVRWPGRVAPRRDETPVNAIDLAPTVLAACGLDRDPRMTGVDLLDAAAVAARPAIFGDVHSHNAVDLHEPAANLEYRWCRQGRWKLIVPSAARFPDRSIELFDLAADPFERTNLAKVHPERVTPLRTALDAWWDPR